LRFILLFVLFYATLFSKENQTPVTLQLIWKYQFQFAGYIMAKEKGFYDDEGLNVTLKEFEVGKIPTDEVKSGRAQFGIGYSGLILENLNNHQNFIQLFALCQSSPSMLQTIEGKGIKKLSDIKGKKLLIYDNDRIASITSMLYSAGIQRDDIQYVMATKEGLDEILDDTADMVEGYSTITPYHLKKMGYKPIAFYPKDYGYDFYGDILFTTKEYEKSNPIVVQNFYKASLKGWEYAFTHIDETIEIIKSKYDTQNLDPELLKFEANEFKKLAYLPNIPFGDINPIQLEKIVNTFKLLGETNSPVTDFSDFVYSPDIYHLMKYSFEEKGIKLEFSWNLFWQILSLIALILIYILFKNIKQKKEEKEKLEIEVAKKTQELQIALDEKGLLLKELNHRVKNNMQTIISLIRLQSEGLNDEKVQDIFTTIQNRINAMSILHELLYKQDTISQINTYDYFEMIVEELKKSYQKDTEIYFDITTDLEVDEAIYCGIILNELITNAFKYAFPNKDGEIKVSLEKGEKSYILRVSDNGIGYDETKPSNGLGTTLIEKLAKKQLAGDLVIDTTNGVTVTIKWGL